MENLGNDRDDASRRKGASSTANNFNGIIEPGRTNTEDMNAANRIGIKRDVRILYVDSSQMF